MEIKINCTDQKVGTCLYEGNDIQHKFIPFKNVEDFHHNFLEITQNVPTNIIGIPEGFYKKDYKDKDSPGFFLLISRVDIDKDWKYIVVMNSTVFITNKGQTIDKVIC